MWKRKLDLQGDASGFCEVFKLVEGIIGVGSIEAFNAQ